MIDASVVTDWLLQGPSIARQLHPTSGERLAAPHLLDAEVAHALRRHVLTGHMPLRRALAGLAVFMSAPIERFPHTHLLPRAFALRDNATIYDALYIALAEALDATLLTRDSALTTVPGIKVRIEVVL